jgi:hypothetical protein
MGEPIGIKAMFQGIFVAGLATALEGLRLQGQWWRAGQVWGELSRSFLILSLDGRLRMGEKDLTRSTSRKPNRHILFHRP